MSEVISLHDQIICELFDKKALSALIWLVDHGREQEFRWQGRLYLQVRVCKSCFNMAG